MAGYGFGSVLAGKYDGCKIATSVTTKDTYIITTSGAYVYFSQNTVSKIEDISTTHYEASAGDVAVAAEFLGAGAGMSVAQGTTYNIKKVYWKDGSTSLIRVNGEATEGIIIGMYNQKTEQEELYQGQKERNKDETFKNILGIIILVFFFLYMIASS
jgi:hypothetical protein